MSKRFYLLIALCISIFSGTLQAQQAQLFPGATWLQDVHFPGTVYAGVGAPVMSEVQAHFGSNGEIMFYLKSDVARATPLIDDLHAQGKKYWVNLDASRLEGIDVQAIIDDGQGISDPAFGAIITLQGKILSTRSINRQDWRNFLIASIERAIDAGADGSQHDAGTPPYDSFDDEDLSAFEQYVTDQAINTGDWDMNSKTFRQYLLDNGKTDADVFDTQNDPQNIKDLIGYWFDFKSIQTLQSWQTIKQTCRDYAQSKAKDYTLAMNAASAFGTHDGHVYSAADYYIGEFFGWGNYYPMTGTIAARSRLAQAFGKRFICWSAPTLDDISAAPNYDYGLDVQSQAEMALITQLYASGGLPQLKYPANRTYPAFYLAQTNSDVLNSVEPYGRIGVIMSHAQTLDDVRGLEGLITVLQDISRSFEVLWCKSNRLNLVDDLTLSDLQKYDVIFLPEVFFLTDNQRNLLLTYMDNGGTVVGVRGNVEYCGYYDELGNLQSNSTWAALVNQNSSGIYPYGAGRFINIAHNLKESSGYPPSLYGLAYTNDKADPSLNYFAKSIRDTVEKWMDVALPERDLVAAGLPGYMRFFRYQDIAKHSYVYQVTSDSVDLSSREPALVGPFDVALKVDPASYDKIFEASWHSIAEPEGVSIGSGLSVDQQTGLLSISIPEFSRWGFVQLDGLQNAVPIVEIGNLTINGAIHFRRLKSRSAVQANWDVISGTPSASQLEVWTNLNGSGDPVVTHSGTALIPSETETFKLLKGARRVLSASLSAAATNYLIPASALRDSIVYLLRVRAIENTDSSGWIKQFFYRNAVPGKPHDLQIYNGMQNLWYYAGGTMSPPDTSQRPVFAFNKAPEYGGDFELDSLSFGVEVYTDSMSSKTGDSTKATHFIGEQFKHKLAWNESMPQARGDIQDTLQFSLTPYENYGIYFRALANDGIDSSAFSSWFGFYLDNHNDPPNPFDLLEPADNSFTNEQIPFKWTNNHDPDPLNLENMTIRQVDIFFDSVATFDSPGLKSYSRSGNGMEFESDTITLNLPSNYFQFEGLLSYDKVFWKAQMWDYDRHSADGSNSLSRESTEIFVLNIGSSSSTLQAPLLQQPNDNAQMLPLQVELKWQAVSGAQTYRVQVAADANFQQMTVDIPNHPGISFFADHLENKKTYYWRVQAHNASGQSLWSPTWKFTTIELPSAVMLISPANDEVLSVNTPVFYWRPSGPLANKYDFEYAENPSFSNAVIDSAITDTIFAMNNLKTNTKYWWRVRAKNIAGWGPYSDSRSFMVIVTNIFDSKNLRTQFALGQNYPNPFNPSTKIFFSVPRSEYVEITLYNISGQKLKTLYAGRTAAGIHRISVDMADLPSGIYFYQLTAANFRQTKKMQVLH